jgi:hypothetical protein
MAVPLPGDVTISDVPLKYYTLKLMLDMPVHLLFVNNLLSNPFPLSSTVIAVLFSVILSCKITSLAEVSRGFCKVGCTRNPLSYH